MEKSKRIELRVSNEMKIKWESICKESGIYLSEFIISSVENKMLHSEKKEIMSFIDKQVNVFSKIENNINQIAKFVNTEKSISDDLFNLYLSKLDELNKMKNEQNNLIKQILYSISK